MIVDKRTPNLQPALVNSPRWLAIAVTLDLPVRVIKVRRSLPQVREASMRLMVDGKSKQGL